MVLANLTVRLCYTQKPSCMPSLGSPGIFIGLSTCVDGPCRMQKQERQCAAGRSCTACLDVSRQTSVGRLLFRS
jgi:hypothetical protein